MDLVADKLLENLSADYAHTLSVERICPPFRVRFGAVPLVGGRRLAFNADRMLNRTHDYPRFLRRRVSAFQLFHVCDHSYANLVHELPGSCVGVFCHDLDTFRCLLSPESEPRPAWFKALARRSLEGLQKAAVVFHTTSAVRAEIERYGLVESARLVQAPYGIGAEFSPRSNPTHDAAATRLLEPLGGAPFLLHVGSCIPRKRVDVLLDAFAAVRRERPELRLVQVGGQWSREQRSQLTRYDIQTSVLQLPRMVQAEIAALYRQAALVMMPSQSEGFGLPVVEALACGSIVVATDIPVFREVGGAAVTYCTLADVAAWAETVTRLVSRPDAAPNLEARLLWSTQFSWREHARRIANSYQRLTS
jgi:glycosyltransferase involved in cell wall biosynthesis